MDDFRTNITALHGEDGKQWLSTLDALIDALATSRSLTVLPPYPNLTYHYVVPVESEHHQPYVLKLGYDKELLANEVATLTAYNEYGAVKIVEHDTGAGWILLARLTPGTPLKNELCDEKQIETHVNVANLLHQALIPDEHEFLDLKTYMRLLFNDDLTHAIDAKILAYARDAATDLLNHPHSSVLLHGDLHGDNILAHDQDTWLAIDPRGIIGETTFDLATSIHQPVDGKSLDKRHLLRRLDIILNVSPDTAKHLLSWALIQNVISLVWFMDDAIEPPSHIVPTMHKLFELTHQRYY